MTEPVQLTIPAHMRYLNIVGATVTAYVERIDTIDDQMAYNLQLAVHEVCTNIIDHAYEDDAAGQIISVSLNIQPTPPALIVSIYDEGNPFDLPETIPQPADELQERGLGLFLVYELMDEVRYTRRDERNHWHLMKQLTALPAD